MKVTVVLVLSFIVEAALGQATSRKPEAPRTVVFVCEHGNVKSLIAREWFNRLASERGLDVRGVSRGVTPEPAVPPAITEALRGDGFDVSGFTARPLSSVDSAAAIRVVGIGVDLSSTVERGNAPLETWQGIPAASEGYAASRDAMRVRIEALLKAIEAAPR